MAYVLVTKYEKLGNKLQKIALRLKDTNFPLHGGFDNKQFSDELSAEAKVLHREICGILTDDDSNSANSLSLLDIMKIVIPGQTEFDVYTNLLKEFDSSEKCNAVWPIDYVAYRCSTCAFNPCMSLCAECFLNGDHEGHDYSRFFSLAGGACDCGNDDVLDPKGFCRRHGPNRPKVQLPPPALTALPEFVFVKLIVHLVNNMRKWCAKVEEYSNNRAPNDSSSLILAVSALIFKDVLELISVLQFFIDQGAPIIDIVANLLLNKELYSSLNDERNWEDGIEDLSESSENFLNDLKSLHSISFPDTLHSHINGVLMRICVEPNSKENFIDCECLLDELLFYLIRLAFPQILINFVLSLLSHVKYKEWFSCKFFSNYYYIAQLAMELMNSTLLSSQSNEPIELSNRITHMSVQIFSSLNISKMLHEKIPVIDKIFNVGIKIMFSDAKQLQLNHYECDNNINEKYFIADIEGNAFILRFGYSYLVTDMQNIFAHLELADALIRDSRLCTKYAYCMGSMQGINLLWRIIRGNHIETENVMNSTRPFTVEWDSSATIMFNTLASIQELPYTKGFSIVLQTFTNVLKQYFRIIKLENGYNIHHLQCPPFCVTFHLPLHRHLSYALWQGLSVKHLEYMDELTEFIADENFLRLCVQHPLRLHVVRAEHYAGMWVRNGSMLRNAVNMYDRPAFTFGFQIPDIFLIRFCAASINQEFFLNMLYYSFHLNDCIRYQPGADEDFEILQGTVITSVSWIPFMFDGYSRLLLEILTQNVNSGLSMRNNLRAELICALSFGSFPHSKLKSAVPDRGNKFDKDYSQIFDIVLEEVADYQEPDQGDNIRQGQYKLKETVWLQEFDPVLCRMRCISPKEFNTIVLKSEERDIAYLKKTKGANFVEEKQHMWLGYRLFDFDTRECFKAIKPMWALMTQPTFYYTMHFTFKQWLISDQEQNLVLQKAVYLLTLAVKFVLSKSFETIVKDRLYHIGELPVYNEHNKMNNTCKLLKTPFHAIEVQDALDCRTAVLSFFTCPAEDDKSILSLILAHFEKCFEAQGAKPNLVEVYSQLMQNYVTLDIGALNRIFGSAKAYFGRLLCLLYRSDLVTRKILDDLYETHVLKNTEKQLESVILSPADGSSSFSSNEATINEKKILAKRKQAALLQLQKIKHARLMKKMMGMEGLTQAEMDEMDTKTNAGINQPHALVYECPICNDQSTCTLNNLMGVMVHVQTNQLLDSVTDRHVPKETLMEIGAKRKNGKEPLPNLTKLSLNQIYDSKMFEGFHNEARFARFTSGVNVCTCGHTAHLVCFKAYVETLEFGQHHPAFPTEHTYSCPICRQPVNGILPLKPELGFEKTHLQFNVDDEKHKKKTVEILRNLITQKRLVPSANEEEFNKQLYLYFSTFAEFEDLCRRCSAPYELENNLSFGTPDQTVFHAYRNKSQGLLLGIVRVNIDYQLLLKQKGIATTNRNRKFDILKHLLYKTRLGHDFFMDETVIDELFKFIGDKILLSELGTIKKHLTAIPPILVYDVKSFLCLICSYILPDECLIDSDKFELCKFVYQMLLCMTLCNAVLHVFLRMSKDAIYKLSSGTYFSTLKTPENSELAHVCDYISEVIRNRLNLFFTHTSSTKAFSSDYEEEQASNFLLSLCEHVCSDLTRFFIVLIDEHNLSRYLARQPDIITTPIDADDDCIATPCCSTSIIDQQQLNESNEKSQFQNLFKMNFVELYAMITGIRPSTTTNSALVASLQFAKPSMIEWVDRLDEAIFEDEIDQVMMGNIMEWHNPCILELPRSYDELFALFFGSLCSACGASPSTPLICLICGELCCLDRCCAVSANVIGRSVSEVERHAYRCGFGCGCFLALHSSLVVIVRNLQAIIWGSVYLDSYGEEDRNLKRGKPLFLSLHRLQRLEEDWLRQSFVRKGFRNWLTIDNLLLVLRDAHYYN